MSSIAVTGFTEIKKLGAVTLARAQPASYNAYLQKKVQKRWLFKYYRWLIST
jgi:hypothetical protein